MARSAWQPALHSDSILICARSLSWVEAAGRTSINVALADALAHLLLTYQIIHVTGQQEAGAMRQLREQLGSESKRRYRPYGFLHEDMARAFAAADLVVCRAGASVLGEIPGGRPGGGADSLRRRASRSGT